MSKPNIDELFKAYTIAERDLRALARQRTIAKQKGDPDVLRLIRREHALQKINRDRAKAHYLRWKT